MESYGVIELLVNQLCQTRNFRPSVRLELNLLCILLREIRRQFPLIVLLDVAVCVICVIFLGGNRKGFVPRPILTNVCNGRFYGNRYDFSNRTNKFSKIELCILDTVPPD